MWVALEAVLVSILRIFLFKTDVMIQETDSRCIFASTKNITMKTEKEMIYVSPMVFVLEIQSEGVLCSSNESVPPVDGEW